jgi:hypothetical protein
VRPFHHKSNSKGQAELEGVDLVRPSLRIIDRDSANVHRGERICVPLCVRGIGWRDSSAADARQPYDSGFKLNTTAPLRLALAAFQYTISSLTVIIVARMQRCEDGCDAPF